MARKDYATFEELEEGAKFIVIERDKYPISGTVYIKLDEETIRRSSGAEVNCMELALGHLRHIPLELEVLELTI